MKESIEQLKKIYIIDSLVRNHNITINRTLEYCFDYTEDYSEEIERNLLRMKNEVFEILDKLKEIEDLLENIKE